MNYDDSRCSNVQKFLRAWIGFSSTSGDLESENPVVTARAIRRRAAMSSDHDRPHSAHDRQRIAEQPGRRLWCPANPGQI
ncbi:hypothetical protein [Bradyrhizobium sp. Ce-3]|uniref:hypothetical protein n=1 Tax=Bradyrhizobium sp. Ce-3 TaxID=2913970 RepID=UPI001FC8095E|nr:hypothetical protein [Bradyrhizobium sp. Ce-3]